MCVCGWVGVRVCMYVWYSLVKNGYFHMEMEMTNRVQIYAETVSTTLCANTLGKGINLYFIHQAIGNI